MKKSKIPESLRKQLSEAGKRGWQQKIKKAQEKSKVAKEIKK